MPDLIESVARAGVDAGGPVKHIMSDTKLRQDMVGADLRFFV